MAIPESQLDIWAKQGSVTQSRDTYAIIKNALEDAAAPFANRGCTSFLQGSYGNDTNIYADSDVDVVIRLDSVYYSDLDELDEAGKSNFNKAFSAATYTHAQFKAEVTEWLQKKFGNAVKPGAKAVFVKGTGNRRDADVLPAACLRRYLSFPTPSNPNYVEGICFFLGDGTRIDNFPKQHSANCSAKHQSTSQWFKPAVRIFKNMRNRMIDDGLIVEGLAPSYYLEGLLYNVPDSKFGSSYKDTVINVTDWLLQTDRSRFVCANKMYYLLRENSPVTWRAAKCTQFLDAVVSLWKNW